MACFLRIAKRRPRLRYSRGMRILTVLLLVFGWVLAGIGALVGLILLWYSRTWTVRQKVLGTLIPLAVLGIFVCNVAASTGSTCSSRTAPCAAPPVTAGDVVALVIAALLVIGIVAVAVSLLRSGRSKPPTVLASH